MNDAEFHREPEVIRSIVAETNATAFNMISETRVGALLAALAASKPAGRMLELGTGTGHGTAWLLAGMDTSAILDTVDTDARVMAVAQRHLGGDSRVRFHLMDGGEFLRTAKPGQFDLIYADAWPGKFSHLDEALQLLRPGGVYVVDDLLPQANWPDGHAAKVPALIADLERRPEFATARLAWASGLCLWSDGRPRLPGVSDASGGFGRLLAMRLRCQMQAQSRAAMQRGAMRCCTLVAPALAWSPAPCSRR